MGLNLPCAAIAYHHQLHHQCILSFSIYVSLSLYLLVLFVSSTSPQSSSSSLPSLFLVAIHPRSLPSHSSSPSSRLASAAGEERKERVRPPHGPVATSHVEGGPRMHGHCGVEGGWLWAPRRGSLSREPGFLDGEQRTCVGGRAFVEPRGPLCDPPRGRGGTGEQRLRGRGREVTGWPWSADSVSYRAPTITGRTTGYISDFDRFLRRPNLGYQGPRRGKKAGRARLSGRGKFERATGRADGYVSRVRSRE